MTETPGTSMPDTTPPGEEPDPNVPVTPGVPMPDTTPPGEEPEGEPEGEPEDEPEGERYDGGEIPQPPDESVA